MSGLTRDDFHILNHYVRTQNRELYWNYLAQLPGNDGYGLLALGVVRNDSTPGQTANAYAQEYAKGKYGKELTEREWQPFGVDLIERDYAARAQLFKDEGPEKALNMPVLKVQEVHAEAFTEAKLHADAWTLNIMVKAAFERGGEQEAEKLWTSALNNKGYGSVRLMDSMAELAKIDMRNLRDFIDSPVKGLRQTGELLDYAKRLIEARVEAGGSLPHTDPHRIGYRQDYYQRDNEGKWTRHIRVPGAMDRPEFQQIAVTDKSLTASLDDTRDVRVARQQQRAQFHPGDPYREIARSPFLLSDQTTPDDAWLAKQTRFSDQNSLALHNSLRQRLPPETSPDRLAQVTVAARMGGITAGNLQAVDVDGQRLHVVSNVPGLRGSIDLASAPPPQAESLQQLQHHHDQETLGRTRQAERGASQPAMDPAR